MGSDLALMPAWFAPLVAGIVGSAVGSFLNVCILRWPAEQSVVHPPSHCPKCARGLRWYENVPVLGWLMLRGKCGGCRLPISPMYPLIELAVALLFAGGVALLGPTWEALRAIAFCTILLGVTMTDAREMIIPDEFSLGGTVIGFATTALATTNDPLAFPASVLAGSAVAWLAWQGTLDGVDRRPLAIVATLLAVLALVVVGLQVPAVRPSLFGALVGFGSLWVVGVIGSKIAGRDAMGGGDLKLMAMVGAVTGMQGVALTVFLGAALGAAVFGPLALLRREKHLELPFGVFLAPAAVVAYVAGDRLVHWYLVTTGLA